MVLAPVCRAVSCEGTAAAFPHPATGSRLLPRSVSGSVTLRCSPAEAMGGQAPARSPRSVIRRPPRLRRGRGGRESIERRARGALLRWEALVDHGAVATFEVELGDNCRDGATGAGDRDGVLRVVAESAHCAR